MESDRRIEKKGRMVACGKRSSCLVLSFSFEESLHPSVMKKHELAAEDLRPLYFSLL